MTVQAKQDRWRKRLVQPIVPQGEGPGAPLSMRFPKGLLKRVDACADATGNTRTDVVMHLLRWALETYETERLREQVKK